ncbi:DMT family transporter [Streptomyces coeruleoprunus]|uniref:DMT family transporter n=1 Tax=Streptomyces coeruleoprunus TaxID=285563 RepID=A0ABV9XI06_9ACTN
MSTKSRLLTGAAFAFLAPVIWGGMFPIANDLMPTVDVFHMTLIRYVTAAAILLALLLAVEGRPAFSFEGKGTRAFLLGASGFAGFGLLAFTALDFTTPTNVSLIMAMMPSISVVIGALQTRKAPPGYTVVTVLTALAGVSLVITKGHYGELFSGGQALGELIALAGATCWILYTRGAASFPGWSPLRYTALTTAVGCVSIAAATAVAVLTGYVSTPSLGAVTAGWAHLLYLIVPAGVIAVFSWNKGIGLLGPLNGALFMNLVPITTFTIAIAGGYEPQGIELLGAAVVVASLVANNVISRRAAARAERAAQSPQPQPPSRPLATARG